MISAERKRQLKRSFKEADPNPGVKNVKNGFAEVIEYMQSSDETLSYEEMAFLARWYYPLVVPPVYLSRFLAQLCRLYKSDSILDPQAHFGWLSAGIADELPGAIVDSITELSQAEWLKSQLALPNLNISRQVRPGFVYDAIVSFPNGLWDRPEPYKSSPKGGKIRDVPGLLSILDAADHLAEDGLIAWAVPPLFMNHDRPKSVRQNLDRFGLHLSGILQLRPGAIKGWELQSMDLALIERQPHGNLFVGAIQDDENAQEELISRFLSRERGPEPALGYMVKESTFYGLPALEAAERARKIGIRKGLEVVPVRSAATQIIHSAYVRGDVETLDHNENAVYIPPTTHVPATLTQEQLPAKLRRYTQVTVDPDVVRPEYLVGWLNSRIGIATRDAANNRGVVPVLSESIFRELDLFLPSITVQDQVLNAKKTADLLETEIQELKGALWDHPHKATEIERRLKDVNHEERLQDWIEVLPFPLASILRAYWAEDKTAKDKYERLLHFFEALACFFATVHLSAARQMSEYEETPYGEIKKVVKKGKGLRWDRPSFGLWKVVNERCAGSVRKVLSDKSSEREPLLRAYGLQSPGPLECISARRILRLIQQTNEKRNLWTGHGGAVDDKAALERLELLEEYMRTLRSQLGRVFSEWQLLLPEKMEKRKGPIWDCEVRYAVGSNPQLERGKVQLQTAPESGKLCLYQEGNVEALQLASVIRLKDTPQPACYFFSRRTGKDSRFISYHFGARPEEKWSDSPLGEYMDDL